MKRGLPCMPVIVECVRCLKLRPRSTCRAVIVDEQTKWQCGECQPQEKRDGRKMPSFKAMKTKYKPEFN